MDRIFPISNVRFLLSHTDIWAVEHDNSGTQAIVRNLYWDGYHFYAVINSTEYGGAYFGSGVPIMDIPFMV